MNLILTFNLKFISRLEVINRVNTCFSLLISTENETKLENELHNVIVNNNRSFFFFIA